MNTYKTEISSTNVYQICFPVLSILIEQTEKGDLEVGCLEANSRWYLSIIFYFPCMLTLVCLNAHYFGTLFRSIDYSHQFVFFFSFFPLQSEDHPVEHAII